MSRSDQHIFVYILVIISGVGFITYTEWYPANEGVYILFIGAIMSIYLAFCLTKFRQVEGTEDYVYYLGFIFTLTSLAISISRIRELGGTDVIISNFALAVTSTIVGVIFRVILLQVSKNPALAVQEAVIDVAASAQRLRGELDAATKAFVDLRVQTETQAADAAAATLKAANALPQELQVIFERVWKHAEESANKAREKMLASLDIPVRELEVGLRRLWVQAEDNMTAANNKRLADMETLTARLQTAFQRSWRQTQKSAEEATNQILIDVKAMSNELAKVLVETTAASEKIRDQSNGAAAGMGNFAAAVELAVTGLEQLREPEKLIEVKFAPISASFQRTVGSLRQVIEAHITEMKRVESAVSRRQAMRRWWWSHISPGRWFQNTQVGGPDDSKNTRE